LKILVISDLHYPMPYSRYYKKIIKKEKPNIVVLLGDVVAPKTPKDALPLYSKFMQGYRKAFPTEKTVILLGDNEGRLEDYSINQSVVHFLEGIKKLNGGLIYYRYKNLFFFHGNIEKSFSHEKIGRIILGIAYPIEKRIMPYVLIKLVRIIFKLKKTDLPMLGHLHYLGFSDGGVFCGTFMRKKIVYERPESLGYVTIIDKGGKKISMQDITLHRL